ncbi:MAG: SDR family oxidoreductase [Lysobacter sp.]|nr:SDR family oxidoreductase [Lysobacter sp.]
MARHALVTGANRGIGLEFTRQLLARGDRVVAACRHLGKATALNTLAGEYPGRLRLLPLDVALEKSRAELVRELPLVCERLDLLVNNAGVLHSGERFGQLSQALLEDSLRVNALGPLLVTEALAPTLADGARVANVSSMMSSLATRQEFRSPGYCMGKAAQNMATVQLAHALRPRGIVVLALCPGWVQTDMGGEGAQITPAQSVEGLLRVIDGAGPDDSGRFIDWRGEAMAW